MLRKFDRELEGAGIFFIEFMKRFFSGYAGSSSHNFFVKSESVKTILLLV